MDSLTVPQYGRFRKAPRIAKKSARPKAPLMRRAEDLCDQEAGSLTIEYLAN